ncbi:unnamed protein product [Ostreobium quekettii]|uniref:Dephospho-CoA kinase n=1 Tax=Ostreobium quekettii TaxID=121088 RepID=A0A8S1J6V4_9CHLO|nr:unnamed protein product [Ostreobium quekettii]|eukprot:evm.model.scf_1442.2 EVM.evm.TU.scf_1442.2   scf_1442:10068-14759(+)
MKIVGLSGGIATGKSTASELIAGHGIAVVDCDVIAHEVVKPGRWAWRRVVAAFGNDILLDNGELNRDLLGRIVFNDPAARKKLNRATHLPVLLEMARQLLTHWMLCAHVVVVDMPLLFDIKAQGFFKPAVLVDCDEHTQLSRLMARDGSSQQDASARINSQMPLAQKRELADVCLDNSGSREELARQVAEVVAEWQKGRWRSWLTSPVTLVGGLAVAVSYFL